MSGQKEYALTVVYGFNAIEQRRSLWEEIKCLSQGTSMPWVIGGDFNAVLTPQDRLCGNPISSAEIQDFSECIATAGLTELPWRGDFYTWTNKLDVGSRIYSRIDRMLGNNAWMRNWKHISTEYGLPSVSDYSPMILQVSQGPKPPKSPFRFFNVWKDHVEFLPVVTRYWTSRTKRGSMKHLWYNLKKLKSDFKQLNNDEFKHIGQKIIACRTELELIQTEMRTDHSDYLIMKEKEVLLNLEKWSMIEER